MLYYTIVVHTTYINSGVPQDQEEEEEEEGEEEEEELQFGQGGDNL